MSDTPQHTTSTDHMRATLNAEGKLARRNNVRSATEEALKFLDGEVTPDEFSVNTTQPSFQPSGVPPAVDGDPKYTDPKGTERRGVPLSPLTLPTIGDRLSEKNVTWAWYAGGWNAAVADGSQPASEKRRVIYTREDGSPNFQPHHQPFNYFQRFAPNTADRVRHLKDGEEFIRDIEAGSLPEVVFYKPVGILTQHPGYTDLIKGDEHIDDVLARLRRSPQWDGMVVIVTYDENGGFWDHVSPPTGDGWGDRWGPGSRIPTIVVSPYAKKGYVDHTTYDTTSILKFISKRFHLDPLPNVRRNMGDLSSALEMVR